jgi:hypothetical protein
MHTGLGGIHTVAVMFAFGGALEIPTALINLGIAA